MGKEDDATGHQPDDPASIKAEERRQRLADMMTNQTTPGTAVFSATAHKPKSQSAARSSVPTDLSDMESKALARREQVARMVANNNNLHDAKQVTEQQSNKDLDELDSSIRAKVSQTYPELDQDSTQQSGGGDGDAIMADANTTIAQQQQVFSNTRSHDLEDPSGVVKAHVVLEDVEAEHQRIAAMAEDRARRSILSATVKADVVEDDSNKKGRRFAILGVFVVVVVVVATVLGVTLSNNKKSDEPAVPAVVEYLQGVSLEKTLRYPLPLEMPSPAERALELIASNSATFKEEEYSTKLLQAFVVSTIFFTSTSPTLDPLDFEGDCPWSAVDCDENGDVVFGFFSSLKLEGSIPPDIGFLTKLRALYFQRNGITGTAPKQLGLLTSLTSLLLFENPIGGPLPTELGMLTHMERFDVGGTQFTGQFPTEIGLLTNLTDLGLSQCAFSGTLPTELAQLSLLTYLDIYENSFMGTLPTELAAVDFGLIDLSNNRLSGSTDDWQLSPTLDWFVAQGNQFSGPIPSQLPSNLAFLHLGGNALTGTIPSQLGSLTGLRGLVLSKNRLATGLPVELGSLPNLERLEIGDNRILTPFPREFLDASTLTHFSVRNASLTGSPAELLGSWSNTLRYLDVSLNDFQAPIPTQLGAMTMLTGLYLSKTGLTGTIPSELQFLQNLAYFDIAFNAITGTIPSELGVWNKIERAFLYETSLNGTLPFCESERRDVFVADCDEVSCDCCEVCCPEGAEWPGFCQEMQERVWLP